MNVCFVNQDMSLGGSATVVHDLILNWPNGNDKLFLICFFDNFDERYKDLNKIENLKIIKLHKQKVVDFKFLKLLKKTLDQLKPDVISSHLTTTFYLKIVGAHKKCTIYHTIHSEPSKDLPFIYRLVLKSSIRRGKIKLIGVCNYISEKATILYKANCITIRNELNIDVKKTIKHSTVNFLFIGRLVRLKNVDKIILAFDEISNLNTMLTIVGYGEQEEEIKKLCQNNKNINFVGKANDVGLYLASSDVLCLISDREGFPITVLEGLKYGLAFIVSDVGGISEVVKNNENGILIKDISVENIKKAMEAMLSNNLLEKYKAKSKSMSLLFDPKKMAFEYSRVFK